MCFFQIVVFIGYALTLGLSGFSNKKQVIVYSVLFILSITFSTVPTNTLWSPYFLISEEPAIQVLLLLVQYIAVPIIMLASVSGMMQLWYSKVSPNKDPYFLYSISNIGSLVALLFFPFVFEPNLELSKIILCWNCLYYGLVLLILILSANSLNLVGSKEEVILVSTNSALVNWQNILAWIFFAMGGSLVLMTFTAHITTDIAPVPLLWVLPLIVYLLSFILLFASTRFYKPFYFTYLWLLLATLEPMIDGTYLIVFRVIFNLIFMFLLCMIYHGELILRKPAVNELPKFYLAISFGSILAGLFIAFLAPIIFQINIDKWLTVGLSLVLTLLIIWQKKLYIGKELYWSYCIVPFLAFYVINNAIRDMETTDLQHSERNFYGTAYLEKKDGLLMLSNGNTLHGEQFIDPQKKHLATSYYGRIIEILDRFVRKDKPVKYGIVGLGVGTIASYGKVGDEFDFFELDPKIVKIAKNYFTFLTDSKAKIDIQIGDGRILLQHASSHKYDMLLIDAFNSDAIPVHLLTKEALQIYLEKLKPDGLLAFHLSNRYVDLKTSLSTLADHLGLNSVLIKTKDKGYSYLVISRTSGQIRDLSNFASINFKDLKLSDPSRLKDMKPWTDDYVNLFSVVYNIKVNSDDEDDD